MNKLISVLYKIILVFTILGIIGCVGVFLVNMYVDKDITKKEKDEIFSTPKKEIITALICGESEILTDTMIYVKYNTKTGKLAYMSIPRDTYVTNEYCVGHKINAIYRGKNIEPLVQEIEKQLSVDIDYYLVINTKILRELVDKLRWHRSRCTNENEI
ncbi:MAG: LCP family protein [Clostridia bacterium]